MAKKANDKVSGNLVQKVVKKYNAGKQIAEIAKTCHTSKVKVQRILITKGLWTSKRSMQVAELRAQGLSVKEIAECIGKDERTVRTFLPYSRGQYGLEETVDSRNSKEYRERMNMAEEKMVLKDVAGNDDAEVKSDLPVRENESIRKRETGDKAEDKTGVKNEEKPVAVNRRSGDGTGSVYRLKVELVDHFFNGADEDFGMDPEEREEFLRLAKAKNGISREVLVPGSMNLHAMHYVIQKIFGWMNGHLHNFCLSEYDFNVLTGGRVGGWRNLCGSLLHFPSDDGADFYWDDDYKMGQSVKAWYKRKYTGPYVHKAACDTYYDTMHEMESFFERFPQFTSRMPLSEMHEQVVIEESLNFLNERLTLDELLLKDIPATELERRRQCKQWLENLKQKKAETDELIVGLNQKKKKEFDEAIEYLKRWRENQSNVEQMMHMGQEERLLEETGFSAIEWLDDAEYFISKGERKCKKLFTEYNPKMDPLFDTLYYEYDYGDGWCVKITVIEKYDAKSIRKLSGGEQADEELRENIELVRTKQAPRCIATDGLNVLDDVGGIGGFHDMLKILEGEDQEEKESTKNWARGLGWNGRLSKPEFML